MTISRQSTAGRGDCTAWHAGLRRQGLCREDAPQGLQRMCLEGHGQRLAGKELREPKGRIPSGHAGSPETEVKADAWFPPKSFPTALKRAEHS